MAGFMGEPLERLSSAEESVIGVAAFFLYATYETFFDLETVGLKKLAAELTLLILLAALALARAAELTRGSGEGTFGFRTD